jgi:hypothetical protein
MSEPATTQPPTRPHLSPKENFLRLETYANELRILSRNVTVHTALTYALAEYATNYPSSERLAGAQDFINIFLNLAEPKSEPRGAFPDKRLTPPSAESTDKKSPEVKK